LRYRIAILGQVPKSEAILIKNEDSVRYALCPAGVEWRDGPPDSALFAIHDLLSRLAHAEGMASAVALMNKVDQVAIAVAGTDSRVSSSRFENALQDAGIRKDLLRLSSLSEAAHLGSFLGKPGILLRCGHGSSVFAKGDTGESCIVGGWGGMVGDHGSGAWLGKKALNAVAGAIDRSANKDESLFASLLVEASSGLPSEPLNHPFEQMEVDRALSGNLAVRKYLTTVAEHVLTLAEEGNVYAVQLTLRAVEHLASLVGTAYSRVIHDDSSFKLCLRGNLFVSHPKFADKVFCRLSEQFSFLRPTAGGWNGSYSPIVGAGLLAMSCTEPDEIDTIGATFLSSIANEPWARPTPSILPECN